MTERAPSHACSELATIVEGRLHGDDVRIHGVCTRVDEIRGGELFVPVVKLHDGHEDVPAAFAAGAVATLWARGPAELPAGPAIVVDDTASALARLGTHARRALDRPPPALVIGVTGSVGKTTTKELLAGVWSARPRVVASPQSRNNRISVPWVLASTPRDTEVLVVELGAHDVGDIARLCRMARPSVGVVTRIASAHLARFGTLERVVEAKGELFEALPRSGIAIADADDRFFAALTRRSAAPVLGYGLAAGEVRAEDVRLDPELRPSFTIRSPWGSVEVSLRLHGAHQVSNALAAAAAGLSQGLPLAEVAAGLGRVDPSPGRMQLRRSTRGGWVLDDAFNASPESMLAALGALAALPVRARLAVLGPMAELGAAEPEAYARVVEGARRLGIAVVGIGTPAYGDCLADVPAAIEQLAAPAAGEAVLLKGSHAAGLDRLARAWSA